MICTKRLIKKWPRFLSVGKIMHLLLLSIVLTYLSSTWPFGFYNPSRGELHAHDYCVNLLLNELFMTENAIGIKKGMIVFV